MNEFDRILLTLIALIAILTLALVALRFSILWWAQHQRILGYAGLLQSSAWTIVRFMENNPRTTARKNRLSHEKIFQENLVAPAERLKFPNMAMYGNVQEAFPVFMADAARELIEYNRDEVDKFWFKVQGMRNGIAVFLAIMQLGNIGMARLHMIEHMKRQRDEWDNKRKKNSPNFTELKMLLKLPTDWPTGDLPEMLLQDSLAEEVAIEIARAAWRYRKVILAHLEYKIWPEKDGDERLSFAGNELLEAMRDYAR